MKILYLFILLSFVCLAGICQEHIDIFKQVQTKNGDVKVTIRQDSSIMHLVNKYINYCENAKGFPGYRIRIFSDSGNNAREQAKNVKNRFDSDHSEYESHLVYKSPNFEVFVGDFRTKSEALKLLKSIGGEYPSAFIVKSLITFQK